jgi:DNA (cytosine-5)-methyltransferase 1
MKKLQVASFFAGIGGFDLGFERAGFEVNFQCEIQSFCKDVLSHHWPSVPCFEDISVIDAKDIPPAEVWCGGFPCQDLSVARGSLGRHGLNGERSGLFFRLAELAKTKKPRVILMENVHGLLNSNNGRDFAELLHIFDSLQYAVSWRLLNSRYFGLPQSRPRVYICAWLKDPIGAGNSLFEARPPASVGRERAAFLETSWRSGAGPIAPKVAFCLAATSGRHTGTDWSRTYIAYQDAVRRLTPLECERLQGFPEGWTNIKGAQLDAERSDSLRYHALGNAVSVSVVKWIATRIRAGLIKQDKGSKKSIGKREFFADSMKMWPGLKGLSQITGELDVVRGSSRKLVWPNAGILWRGAFVANRTPPSSSKPATSDLLDLIEKARPDKRYFLSANAAEGILRRVDTQARHLFPPLRQALERLCGRKLVAYKVAHDVPQLELHLNESESACVLP